MDERLRHAPIGVLDVGSDGTVRGINDAAREVLDAPAESGVPVDAVAPRSVEDSLLAAFDGPFVADTCFEEYYPDLERWLSVSVVPAEGGATVYLQDVTEGRRHERTARRLRQERKRTAIIDEVLSEVLAELVGASSREEIAETVCRELGETTLYEFAWVGERDIGGDELVVHGAAGETGETFAAVRDALEEGATTPEERAVETGRLQTVQPLADDPAVPDPVRMAGFADGVQSALAVPLVYGSNVHGVVGVYASGEEAFAEGERTAFETLGEVAGFAVTAARNRNLLLSDGVTEVTFEVGSDSALAALSGVLDAEFDLEGLVPRGEDALLCFLSVADDALEAIDDAAADVDGIDDVRAIGDGDAGGTAELEVGGATPLLAVSSLGGTVRRATFEGGTGRVVVDLPPDSDVRRMADAVSRDYDAEVLAKRERERSVTTAREVRDALDDRLTDRQRTVLRTAYLADYFESPRGSTAEEVAASLDITGSTLLHHLRAGQRKLLDAYFTDSTPTDE
jgi:predicted DNA binding protein